MKSLRTTLIIALQLLLGIAPSIQAQTGSIHEPVRYIGGVTIDPNVSDQ